MFYTLAMSKPVRSPRMSPATVSLKVGQWFEAHATGWGVLVVPVVVVLLGAVALFEILAT